MNVKLLRKVAKHILSEPKRLRMLNWIMRGAPGEIRKAQSDGWGESGTIRFPACGTVGCIAGWTCMLSGQEELGDVVPNARKLLRINAEAAVRLFYVADWPRHFRDRYFKATRQRERAKIVGEVIEDFIKTVSESLRGQCCGQGSRQNGKRYALFHFRIRARSP